MDRNLIITVIQDLIIARQRTFDNVIELAMKGEMQHLNNIVDIGEIYEFKIDHFRDVKDPNVKLLVEICDLLETKITLLINRHEISLEELDFDV